MDRLNIHGTGLLLGAHGVLIRGPSGSGKSLLALDLLERWAMRGRAALLVGDDRVELEHGGGGLVMHCPPNIAGLMELRGRGIVRRPHVEAARLDLVVDLVDEVERMPQEAEFQGTISGIVLPRCPVPRRGLADPVHQFLLVNEAVRLLGDGKADI